MAAWRGALGLGLLLLCLLPVPGERGAAAEGGRWRPGSLHPPPGAARSRPRKGCGGDREKGEGGSVPGAASPFAPQPRRSLSAGRGGGDVPGSRGATGGRGRVPWKCRATAAPLRPVNTQGSAAGVTTRSSGLRGGWTRPRRGLRLCRCSADGIARQCPQARLPGLVLHACVKAWEELLGGGQVPCRCSPLLGSEGCNRSADPNTNTSNIFRC